MMDLTLGYHQAPLHPSHRIFTAFTCFAGAFQSTRLPFGPCRAPSYFQEPMVTAVLYGLIYHCCEMYLDDCILYGKGEAEFLQADGVYRGTKNSDSCYITLAEWFTPLNSAK